MFRRLIKDEAGYSLTEVIVAIMLLGIAIIPMVGMFDAGLRASVTSSNYDKARSLANKQLERAKSLSYADAKDKFPGTTAHAGYSGSGSIQITNQTDPDPEYSAFRYSVTKQYVRFVSTGTNTMQLQNATNNNDRMIRISVTVTWGNSNSFTTTGLVAE